MSLAESTLTAVPTGSVAHTRASSSDGAVGGPRSVAPLLPGVVPQLQSDGSIHLGTDPVHGVVLSGVQPGEAQGVFRMLRYLAAAHTPLGADVLGNACGLPIARVEQVATTLRAAGLTGIGVTRSASAPQAAQSLSSWPLARRHYGVEEHVSATGTDLSDRRAGARVVIDGSSPLVADTARLLRAAHVGTVISGWCADVSLEHEALSPDPSLIIAIGSELPISRAHDWDARGIAHLPVVARAGSVDIGPLVVPGTGPCVKCLALGLEDPAGTGSGTLRAGPPLLDDPSAFVAVEPTLCAVAAGTTAMLAVGYLDAYPAPTTVRWHTALPTPSLATSHWEEHPRCDRPGHRRQPA